MLDIFISACVNYGLPLLKSAFLFGAISAVISGLISPLQFLKVQRQQTGKSYREIFYTEKKLHGLWVFYRGWIPYSAMNFYSSAAFGISEFLSIKFLAFYDMENTITGILFRIIAAGLLETTVTITSEIKEITRNKINLMEVKGTISSILMPVYLRNTFSWVGTLVSMYFICRLVDHFHLSFSHKILIAFICGLISSIVGLPLDVITTQSCGAKEKLSLFKRAQKIIQTNSSAIFHGSLMRISILTISTIVTVIVEIILN